MKLVVGLGNPGKEYENTRHNIGYELADMFAKKYDCSFRTERKFEADIFDININGEKVIVAKPLTYMKLSVFVEYLKSRQFFGVCMRDYVLRRNEGEV